MFFRLSVALFGACIVTLALILTMSEIAEMLERPDSQVYMRVMDFIPGSGARRLPDKRMPEAQPERTRVEIQRIDPENTAELDTELEFEQENGDIDVRIDLDVEPE